MKRKRHNHDQILSKLRQAESEIRAGTPVNQVCDKLKIDPSTLTRWMSQYSEKLHEHEQPGRLTELERENRRLQRIVRELELDKRILTEAVQGNY